MKREITNSEDVAFICSRMPVALNDSYINKSLVNILDHTNEVANGSSIYGIVTAFAFGYSLAKHDSRKRLNRTAIRKSPEM